MIKLLKKSISAVIILVVVETIRFHSWNNASYMITDNDNRRRLGGQTIEHPNARRENKDDRHIRRIAEQIDSIIHRTYHGLKATGHKPGTVRFNQLFRNKASHRMDRLRNDLALHTRHLGKTQVDRVHREVKSQGLTPGTSEYDEEYSDRIRRRTESKVKDGLMGRISQLGESLVANEEDVKDRVRQTLEDTENKWIRGDFIQNSRRKTMHSNYHGRSMEEINALEAKEAEEDKLRELWKQKIWAALEEAEEEEEEDELQPWYCSHLSSDCFFADEKVEPLTICDRPTDVGSVEDFNSLQKHVQCKEITKEKPILVLEGSIRSAFGRSGNNILEFLHAIQLARDQDVQLGIMTHSWAMDVLQKMWMAIDDANWEEKFEKAFCVKIFDFPNELEGWDVRYNTTDRQQEQQQYPQNYYTTKELFNYQSPKSLGEYIDDQEYAIRTLFRDYNTGEGEFDSMHSNTRDMCSGIKNIFGENRAGAIYSVIHSRKLEGRPGLLLLSKYARKSGCDPVAALEMRPDYVKSILKPLGMLSYPVVVVHDGQDPDVVARLLQDPELKPLIRLVHENDRWIGGDITLAVMANVFIGNPASSFSGFINKARSSLGFGHSYLWRAKNPETKEWRTVCGDHCVFDKTIYGLMA